MAGTLAIQHGPIPAGSWPAMTMTFKSAPPALLSGLKVRQTIGFETTVQGRVLRFDLSRVVYAGRPLIFP